MSGMNFRGNSVVFIDCQNYLARGKCLEARQERSLAVKAIKVLWEAAKTFTDFDIETRLPTVSKFDVRGEPVLKYMGLQRLSIPASVTQALDPLVLAQTLVSQFEQARVVLVSSLSAKTGYGEKIGKGLEACLSSLTDGGIRKLDILPIYKIYTDAGHKVSQGFSLAQLEHALSIPEMRRAFCEAVVYRPTFSKPCATP